LKKPTIIRYEYPVWALRFWKYRYSFNKLPFFDFSSHVFGLMKIRRLSDLRLLGKVAVSPFLLPDLRKNYFFFVTSAYFCWLFSVLILYFLFDGFAKFFNSTTQYFDITSG